MLKVLLPVPLKAKDTKETKKERLIALFTLLLSKNILHYKCISILKRYFLWHMDYFMTI